MNKTQEQVASFCHNHNLIIPAQTRLLDLVAEVGEFAKEVLEASSYETKTDIKNNEKIILELGDITFSLLCLANSFSVDIDDALNQALMKYQKRIQEKGCPSSR